MKTNVCRICGKPTVASFFTLCREHYIEYAKGIGEKRWVKPKKKTHEQLELFYG